MTSGDCICLVPCLIGVLAHIVADVPGRNANDEHQAAQLPERA